MTSKRTGKREGRITKQVQSPIIIKGGQPTQLADQQSRSLPKRPDKGSRRKS